MKCKDVQEDALKQGGGMIKQRMNFRVGKCEARHKETIPPVHEVRSCEMPAVYSQGSRSWVITQSSVEVLARCSAVSKTKFTLGAISQSSGKTT